MSEIRNLSLKLIKLEVTIQPRRKINEAIVDQYADAIEGGAKFPAAVVFYDGKVYWLASGFHRYHAHEAAHKKQMRCDVREGTERDARLFAKGANKHGLHLTNDEKRDNADAMLQDDEWKLWSDREIARHLGVSHTFIQNRREFLTGNVASENGEEKDDGGRFYTTKHGTSSVMDTANIGAKPSAQSTLETSSEDTADEDDGDPGDCFSDEAQSTLQPTFEPGAEVEGKDNIGNPVLGTVVKSHLPAFGRIRYLVQDSAGTHICFADELRLVQPEESEEEPDAKAEHVARVKNAPIVHDTLKENKPTDESTLSDDEWLEALPLFRVLAKLPHRGILARHSLLSFRASHKALRSLESAWDKCPDTKSLDANDPVARVVGKAADLKSPRAWFVCAMCKGGGCTRCGSSGIDLYAGIDPNRIERGEVAP